MKKIFLFLTLLTNVSFCFAQNDQIRIPTDNQLRTALDSLVERSVSAFMKNSSRMGISVGIIQNGKSFLYNYGSTGKDNQKLPTGNTVYELASITKTFGATLLAKAALDKKVNLNDDIRKYLKEDYPNLEYDEKPIALLNLANLTSGLPNWMPDKDLFGNADPDAIPFILDSIHTKYSREDLYRDLHNVKLKALPGSVSRHCNTAAQLLGFIMENVYKDSFDNLLKIYFTKPLKMKNTYLLAPGKLPRKLAKGYDGKGRLMPVIDWEDLQVAASIASTSSDMLKYMPNDWKSVTIRQLLSNTSGLPNNIDEKEQVLGNGIEEKNWELVKTLPMEFKPGERFSYNQTGYYILGKIITKLSGQHFTRFIEENQFKPCNMTATQFGDSNDIIPNNAGSYSTIINIDGKWINDGKLHNAFATFPVFFRTATGIISTSEDLGKWLIALQNGKLLYNKNSVQELFTSAKLNDGHIDGFNKLTNGYALGWPTVEREDHPAAAPVGGMRSALFVYPQDDLSIVVLTNLQGSNPEWFIDEIAGYYFPDMKVKNGFGLSKNLKLLRQELIKNKFENSFKIYSNIKRSKKDFSLSEDQINSWGYQLIEQNKKQEALKVFKLNTLLFPKSFNVYDSYAETLELLGNHKEAIINYRKSLELNPDNNNARQFLESTK